MIPYILAAVGGYLIGDSLKGKQFARGGMTDTDGDYEFDKDQQAKAEELGGMMAKGGEIDMDVIVKTPKGIVTKKDFEGFTKKEIIEWCEERGWVYNPKGEKLGGRILKEYEFFIKSPTKYNVTLPKKSDGGMMADGGIPKEKSLLHFVQNEASSGSIANKTKYSSYKDIDAIRNKAVQILMRDGDREYSLQAFNDLIQEAVILIEEDELTGESEGERRIGMDYMSDGGWVTAKEVSEERGFYSDMYKDDNGVRPRSLSDEQLADWLNSNYKIVTKFYNGEKRKMIVAKDFNENTEFVNKKF